MICRPPSYDYIISRTSVAPIKSMKTLGLRLSTLLLLLLSIRKSIGYNNTLYRSQTFPPLKNDNLLRAARGDVVDRVPVWVMRQAGRYLPEFQELRKQHDFFTVCRTPELACEVTMQPLRRFDLDASIIFSDILVIPQALGLTVEMHAGVGPVLPQPINTPDDLKRLTLDGALSRLTYVGDAITMMRHKLEGRVPLIGFTGAPWTLMGYMIEGGGSKTMSKAKAWLTKYPEDTKFLLNLLTDVIVDYLEMQVKAGAQMLQIFESSAEHLSKEEFLIWAAPYLRRIRNDLVNRLNCSAIPLVPLVNFNVTMCSMALNVFYSSLDSVRQGRWSFT